MVKSPNFDPLKSLKPPENAGFKLPFWMVKYHRFGWLSHHVISSEITGKITSHHIPPQHRIGQAALAGPILHQNHPWDLAL